MDPINNQNPQPGNETVPSPAPMPADFSGNHEHKKVGPIIATLVIVIVLVVAALYIFGSKLNKQSPIVPEQNTATSELSATDQMAGMATPTASVTPVTNKADDVQSINNDLNSALNGLDSQNF